MTAPRENLTKIEYLTHERWNWWELFGHPVRSVSVSRSLTVATYEPESYVGVSRQWRGEYGVTHWETFILETLTPQDSPVHRQLIPHVSPRALVVLHTYGTEHAKNIQAYIEALRDNEFDPAEAGDLHTRCAPHLRLGTFPRHQLREYVGRQNIDCATCGPLPPTP